MHHRDLLRDRKHHRHVVLGEQQRQAALVSDALQQSNGTVCLGCRHAGGGLVEQQDLRITGKRNAQFDLLLVAVGQSSGNGPRLIEKLDRTEQRLGLVAIKTLGT